VEHQIEKSEPERWERAYSKLFRVLFACGVAFFAWLYLKDWVIGLEQARQRGTLGADLLRTGIRSLPLVAVFGLSFYLRRCRSAIDRALSKGRIFIFIYNFALFFSVTAAFGFLNRNFWSWSILLLMPLGSAAGYAIFAEPPHKTENSEPQQ
jgi:hypothetical protein